VPPTYEHFQWDEQVPPQLLPLEYPSQQSRLVPLAHVPHQHQAQYSVPQPPGAWQRLHPATA
jgi:hypothetical protein